MRNDDIWSLIAVFVPLSLVAVGGGSAVIADIQRQSVDVHHWVTDREFVDLFAISRAAPGPGAMLVALIGWKVYGWTGALVATLALFLPSSLLAYVVSIGWIRYRGQRWHSAIQAGLAPIGTGLILASALAVLRVLGAGPLAWSVVAISTAVLWLRPRFHPVFLLLGAAVVFAAAHTLAN
jgi:chromate transporter